LTQRFLRPVLTTTVPFLHFFAAGLASSADASASAGMAATVANRTAARRMPFTAGAILHGVGWRQARRKFKVGVVLQTGRDTLPAPMYLQAMRAFRASCEGTSRAPLNEKMPA
jgi:hypothetical protein